MDFSGWIQWGLSAAVGIIAGVVSAFAVILKLTRWRQTIDNNITDIHRRLDSGDMNVPSVPIMGEMLKAIRDDLDEIKGELRHARQTYVTRRECDNRHPYTHQTWPTEKEH